MISDLLISAAPVALAGTGALWTELAGSLAIAVEGWMVIGAFSSYCFNVWTGSALAGAAAAAVVAALAAVLLAVFVEKTGANPFIAGLASNLGIAGLVPIVSAKIFGTGGVLRSPELSAGKIFSLPFTGISLSPFVCAALIAAVLSAYLLRETASGLRLRATGLAPQVAAERGLKPAFYRVLSWSICAALAALGGAALTSRLGVYAPGGVAGRGWLALAAVFLGFRSVRGILVASLVFAAAGKLAINAQGSSSIPAQALLGLPSVIALALYALSLAISKNKLLKAGIK
jgi:simple sugar transport system permease protein